MATDTQEYEMGNDNQTDINQDEQMNGSATENGGENQVADSGSAEAPGKDDDRYVT